MDLIEMTSALMQSRHLQFKVLIFTYRLASHTIAEPLIKEIETGVAVANCAIP